MESQYIVKALGAGEVITTSLEYAKALKANFDAMGCPAVIERKDNAYSIPVPVFIR